eukprot:1570622-Rhodomonas_salina.2
MSGIILRACHANVQYYPTRLLCGCPVSSYALAMRCPIASYARPYSTETGIWWYEAAMHTIACVWST